MMVKAFRMLALRHLTERPVRTATTMLGVALGCAVFVAIRTANVEVLRSFEMAVDSVAVPGHRVPDGRDTHSCAQPGQDFFPQRCR